MHKLRLIIRYFSPRRYVLTKNLQGEFVKAYNYNGKQLVRIAFTNKVKTPGTMPMTDVLKSDIIGYRITPSPFQIWLFGLFNKRPRATTYMIKKSK